MDLVIFYIVFNDTSLINIRITFVLRDVPVDVNATLFVSVTFVLPIN